MLLAIGNFVHNIDPVLLRIPAIKFYYYGLAYALGFCGIHFWLRKRRDNLGCNKEEVYEFSILFMISVLLFGRAFEIVFYEWQYYKTHLSELLSFWNGGMASHGVLLGAVLGIFLFSRIRRKSFLRLVDEIAIPGAFLLALGRIGNFINGQICGSVTDVWWAVQFPDIEGFRHPVALYESLKNFMIIPILLLVRRKQPYRRGIVFAHFVFWYGFLRLFTDYFREYGTEFIGIGTGQYFNLLMALAGVVLYIYFLKTHSKQSVFKSKAEIYQKMPKQINVYNSRPHQTRRLWPVLKRVVFTAIIFFSLTIPSAWTQGFLEQYRENEKSSQLTSINTSAINSNDLTNDK
ncbi:MAG: prolipoprotein diacylglyceryl transferase [Planctomycetota bacterium]